MIRGLDKNAADSVAPSVSKIKKKARINKLKKGKDKAMADPDSETKLTEMNRSITSIRKSGVFIPVEGKDEKDSPVRSFRTVSRLFKQTSFSMVPSHGNFATELIALTKRANFKKYIYNSGFQYAIVRAIVALFEHETKPDDPLVWIAQFLGFQIPVESQLEEHKKIVHDLNKKIHTLQVENYEILQRIEQLEREQQDKPTLKEVLAASDEYAWLDWKGNVDIKELITNNNNSNSNEKDKEKEEFDDDMSMFARDEDFSKFTMHTTSSGNNWQ